MKKIITVLIFGMFLSGCATTGSLMKRYSTLENKIPIDVSNENFPPFGVSKIKSAIPPGSAIGGHHDGWAKVKWSTYYAHGFIDANIQEHYREAVRSELENAGYTVYGGGSDLFEDDKTWKARFLVGGKISDARNNTYAPMAGDYSECGFTINWELYDKQARKVIYKRQTDGYSKLSGVNLQVNSVALRNSFRSLLSQNNFVEFVRGYINNPDLLAEGSEPIKFSKLKKKRNEKLNIAELNNAIIAIKTDNGHGSGFIINSEGYAITNYHVIANSNIVDALMKGGKPIEAQVIRTDPDKDLALIKLRGEEYDYLPLGELDNIKIGMDVYAVGAPIFLELSNSLSKGILSGKRKMKDFDITLLQTDVAVNPGNSGGPLINMDGEVIGVVALKIAMSGVEGLGFAISIDDVIKYLNLQEKI